MDVAGPSAAGDGRDGRADAVRVQRPRQITKIIDPLGGETTFTYDGNGNLLTLTDARSKTTTWTYDDMDRVETRTDPLSRDESFAYDLMGNLASWTDRKGQVTTYQYDALDRQTFVGFGTTGVAAELREHDHDDLRRRRSADRHRRLGGRHDRADLRPARPGDRGGDAGRHGQLHLRRRGSPGDDDRRGPDGRVLHVTTTRTG